jgi:pimeloyl-ACP methyl ester carboxylesterase
MAGTVQTGCGVVAHARLTGLARACEGPAMATCVLIHGAGDVDWYRHPVKAELRERRHEVAAPDLPRDKGSAGLPEYADAVIEAIGNRTDLVLVAQSLGAFTAPLVCQRHHAGRDRRRTNPALRRPKELADRLEAYRLSIAAGEPSRRGVSTAVRQPAPGER